MGVPNKMTSAYEELVEAFSAAGENSNCGRVIPSPPPRKGFSYNSDTECATFNCDLLLKNYRWRNSSRSTDTVEILVRAQETICLKPLVLTKSTVRVNYMLLGDSSARLLQCIHYDYCDPPQDEQHPVFHAQFDDAPIDLGGELKAAFNRKVDATGFCCFKNVRIPTADMSLSSVLLSLAADHMRLNFFEEFRKRFLALQEHLPRPAIAGMRLSLGAEIAHLKSCHWFARQPVNTRK